MATLALGGAVESQIPVVIDLTDDIPMVEAPSQPHNHQDAPQTKQEKHTFVSTLAHRLPSTIPHKRKSVENSEASSVSSHIGLSIFRFTQPPSTPSPTPSLKALDNVTVVIPSPSQYQRKSMKASQPARPKYIGLSQECYPTELEEREKAALRTYPTARTVDRSVVPYSASSLQPLRNPSFTASQYLRTTLNTKFRRIEGPAISFDIDDEKLAMLSTNFGFIHEYKLQDGVTPVPDEFNGGCDCDGPCDPKGCGCLYSEVDSDERIVPYHSSEDGQIVLRPDFLHRKSMILECSFRCSCKGKCWNHVVQRGRSVRLQIFDTGPRGFGLRSPDPVIAGQFIDRYLGEVVTKDDADARENTDEKGQSYLFSLDFMVDDDDLYVVDGQKFGSATRFMNHSCNPNCKIITVSTTNHADDRLYYLAFFALRDIPAGTELTFDYNPGWDGTNKFDPSAVRCLCGEEKCRGQLWPNARKTGQKE